MLLKYIVVFLICKMFLKTYFTIKEKRKLLKFFTMTQKIVWDHCINVTVQLLGVI